METAWVLELTCARTYVAMMGVEMLEKKKVSLERATREMMVELEEILEMTMTLRKQNGRMKEQVEESASGGGGGGDTMVASLKDITARLEAEIKARRALGEEMAAFQKTFAAGQS